MCKDKGVFAFLMKEIICMWQMQSDIVFMEAPPFPLLWFASGVYFSSRWHHGPGWGEKILYKDPAWNPFIACWRFSARQCSWIPKDQAAWLHFTVSVFLHCQLLGHVTTVLFNCLQKLNTAMPPCHPSAVERGKAWKGKAKARKTQVAGKCCSGFFSSATNCPSPPTSSVFKSQS